MRRTAALAGLTWLAPSGSARAAEGEAPLRLLVYFVPNGFHMPAFKPTAGGTSWTLPPLLDALQPLKAKTSVLTNLRNEAALPTGHALSTGSILTGVTPQGGDAVRSGISIDQLISEHINDGSRVPSLHLATEGGEIIGSCEPDYSCAYYQHVSWLSETVPMPNLHTPERALQHLFGVQDPLENPSTRSDRRARVADFIAEEARALQLNLSSEDSHRIDEFLTATAALEERIERDRRTIQCEIPAFEDPLQHGITAINEQLADVVELAFRCDATRVVTFMDGHAGSSRIFNFLGVSDPFHNVSHHGGDPSSIDAYNRIVAWECRQFAALCQRLDATPDVDGRSVLDNTVALFISGMGDGDQHDVDDMGAVICGATGRIRNDAHIALPVGTPVADLHITLASLFGLSLERFGNDGSDLLRDLLP